MGNLNIMIVEDDAPLRTIMQLLLEEQPHRVQFADSGRAALERAAQGDLDVIVIDVGLPDMSGFELARSLRSAGSTARLVAFTGYDDDRSRQQAEQAGFDVFFHKPLDLGTMEAIFDEILNSGGRSDGARPT
jgi:CheY-like chemotaxis protein